MLIQERHNASSAMLIVKTFHDGVSVEFEIEESLGGQQVFRVFDVDCLVTAGAAWSHICEKKSSFMFNLWRLLASNHRKV